MGFRIIRRWSLAGVCWLAGCNIDTLAAEFHATEPLTSTTRTASSSGEAGSSSSSGEAGSSSSSSSSSSESTEGAAEASAPDTETTADSSTGTPTNECGDGVVGEGEECDDGNDDDMDGCDNSCAAAWTIFVTAESMYSGNINGLVGADTRCRQQANLGGLPRWDRFKALLSDSTTDAAERLHNARGWYRLVNGLPVAHGWEGLMTGPLENPVNVDPLSQTANVSVWTGTLPGGIGVPGADHCKDWLSELDSGEGTWGRSSEVDEVWLQWPEPDFNPTLCGVGSRALYCVEQP